LVDEDGDSTMDSDEGSEATTTAGEGEPDSSSSSPKAPSFRSIGHPAVPTHEELQQQTKPDQLASEPGGDAYPKGVQVEGMMDTSEGPLKL
jgi:protein phosphatase 2C family protein 2/3